MKRIKKVFLYKLNGVLKRPLEIAEYFGVSKNTINRLSNGLLVGDVESFEYKSKNNDLKGIVEVERFF